MQTLQTLLFVLQILVAISLIGFILIQHGKGADAGAAFGSGASSTVFGARGSANFLTRATTVLAAVFLINSLALGYLATQRVRATPSLMERSTGSVVLDQPAPGEPPVQGMPMEEPVTGEMPAVPESDVPVLPESDVPALPEE